MNKTTDNRPKMLIVDGSSLLSTCYFAALPDEVKKAKTEEEKEVAYRYLLQNSEGIYTNGILGMARTLVHFIEEWKPDYLAVAFDKSRNTFRKKKCETYKAQRGKTPQPLKDQMILMEQLLSESGIPVFISDNYEADDIAGSIAEKYKKDMRISLLTKDRDYLQLVDDEYQVTCLILSDKKKANDFRLIYQIPEPELGCMKNIMEFTAERVKGEKYVWPNQIADLKAIEGDVSDNISGVKGVSTKTVIPLLEEYGSIERIYEALEEAGDDKEMQSKLWQMWKGCFGLKRNPIRYLLEGKEDAMTSKWLATIVRDIEIPDFTGYPVNKIRTDIFNNWMDRLEIRNIRLKK